MKTTEKILMMPKSDSSEKIKIKIAKLSPD